MSLQKTEYDIPLVWDDVPIIDLDRYEVWRAPYLPVVGVNQGTKKFTIDRLLGSWFEVGDALLVTGSTGNDKSYTVVSVVQTTTQTVIEVSETIPSAVANGWIGKTIIDQLAAKPSKPSYTDKDMPVGFYYYIIYAVDKLENFSDPSDIVLKYSPTDTIPPAAPTGLIARRNAAFESVDLKWNDVEDETLKGYIISRTLNPYAGTPTWEVIAIVSPSKYKDSEIPLDNDAVLRVTEVAYVVQSYDKSGNVSASTAATYIFTIPLIQGLRTSLDYLSINVFWDAPLPEDGVEAVAIFYRQEGTTGWTFAGAVEGEKNIFRIDGPLNVGRDYEVAVAVVTSDLHPIIREDFVASDKVYIDNDERALFTTADQVAIVYSAGMDGVYTLGTVTFLGGVVETQLQLIGHSDNGVSIDAVDQTLGYFGTTGDVTADWTGDKIIIAVYAGTMAGRYTVNRVTFDGLYTRIYVEEPIPAGAAVGDISSGLVLNISTSGFQVPIDMVPIPEYQADTTEPTAPFSLLTTLDPETNKIFLNWSRVAVENDFLEFYVDMTNTAADFTITAINPTTDSFTVAGDQTAYFIAGDRIFAYNGTNNNGWWTVISATFGAGVTVIVIDGQLDAAVTDGLLMSDRLWWNLDKTRNTNFQAFYNFIVSTTYRFRIRAVDRSTNLSDPTACTATVLWDNTDLTGGGADPLMLPQWIDYTEQELTSYMNAEMRRYALLINDGPSISEFYKKYTIYIINRPWTPSPQSYFALTKDEVMARPTFNTLTVETIQFPNTPIIAVNQGTKTFTIGGGDFTGYFTAGDTFRISGSTGNDTTYVVASSTYVPGPNTTEIITVGAIPDPTVDGQIDWSIFLWPAVLDTFGSVWVGPTSAIRNIPAT